MEIKRIDIRIFLTCLLLFLGLFRICLFPNRVYWVYSFIILGAFLVLVGGNNDRIWRNRWAILFGMLVAFSVIFQNFSITSIFKACTYFLEFTVPFLVIDFIVTQYGIKPALKGLMFASLFICLTMDLSVWVGMDIDKTHYQNLVTYLFGNKFMVAYLHMQTMGLIAEYKSISGKLDHIGIRMGLLAFGIYGIILCRYVNCATGIIGIGIITFFIVVPINGKIKEILSKPVSMMLVLLGTNILLIGSDALLRIPFIQSFIVDILHKDLTLTGRFHIYSMLPDLVKKHPFLGYGYNSDIFAELIGYGNAQNGILQYVLDCGIIGAILFIINWIQSILKARNREQITWPMISVVYGFIVCSLVEVCFKLNFIVILAVISCCRFIDNGNDKNIKQRNT